jgi:hypothetical protein
MQPRVRARSFGSTEANPDSRKLMNLAVYFPNQAEAYPESPMEIETRGRLRSSARNNK